MAASRLRDHLRVSYAKVAEYQRRGLVHFHAVVRLDGPDGPDGPAPPSTVTAGVLTGAVEHAAATTTVITTPVADIDARTLGWGAQVDVSLIGRDGKRDSGWHEHGVSGYVAEYATKGTGLTTGADKPLRSVEHVELLDAPEHAKELMRTAWHLGGFATFEHLNLRKWAHMLGFRGHFLTKSRHYSTTITLNTYVGYWPDAVDQTRSLVDGALGCTGPVPE